MTNGKIIIFFIIFILLIAGGLLFFLFKVYKTNTESENLQLKEILIKAIDNDGNQVEANFSLWTNHSQQVFSTRNDSYTKIKVPVIDELITLTSLNPGVYYSDIQNFSTKTIEFRLRKIGNLSIYSEYGNISSGIGSINLTLISDYTVQNIGLCLRWSVNVIEANLNDYFTMRNLTNQLDCINEGYVWINETTECNILCKLNFENAKISPAHCSNTIINKLPPKRLNDKIDKCYYIEKTIDKQHPLNLVFSYKAYNNTNEYDFIRFYVLDSEIQGNRYVFEDISGNDIGAKDFEFNIN